MSDQWYYAVDGTQQGPVSAEQFARLVELQTIGENCLVWREGMEQWQPLRLVPEAPRPGDGTPRSGTDDLPPSLGDQCSVCRQPFSRGDLALFSGRLVCADCKPAFLARIREGLSLPSSGRRRALPVNPDALIDEVRQRGYSIDVGAVFARAWQLYKADFWPSFGVSCIAMILIQAASFVPFLGALIGILIQGPILAGMYLYYLKRVRGQRAEIGDVFWGFNPQWWRYLLTTLVTALPMFAFLLVIMVPVGIGVAVYSNAGPGNTLPDWLPWLLVPVGIVVFLGAMYLQIAITFALPLSADLELGPIQSVLTSLRASNLRILSLVLLFITMGFLALAGVLALVVGVLFVLPLNWYAIVLVYEEIFAPRDSTLTASTASPAAGH